MIHADMLHNAGIIPTTDTFQNRLTETALLHGLPVVAALQGDTLMLKAESASFILPLLCSAEQLEAAAMSTAETGLAAVGEHLCGELDALAAAYPQIKWIPVGRFAAQQLAGYMKSPHVCAVCDTSFLDMSPEEWDGKCQLLRATALGYSFAHVGIHNEEESGCLAVVNTLQEAFGFPVFDIGSSVIVEGSLEITKSNPFGTSGHIGIETASVARAMNDLQSKGFDLDEATIQYYPTGRPQSVYLNTRLGGFTVHLLQKR